ncbi:hypothetical protein CHUAL_005109 [Chamberlinius hualienensis]
MFHSILIVLILATAEPALAIPTRCDELPKLPMNIQWLLDSNPFYTFWGNWNILKCTQINYIPPPENETRYNLTANVIKGSIAFSFQISMNDTQHYSSLLCTTGVAYKLTNGFLNFDGTNRAFCIVNCNSQGGYNIISCIGRTKSDSVLIKQFIDDNEIPLVTNMQKGCVTADKFCPNTFIDHQCK